MSLKIESINAPDVEDDHLAIKYGPAPREEYKIVPKEFLVMILHRPQEPINPLLLDATYRWVDDGASVVRMADPFGGWVNTTRNFQSRQFLKRQEFKWLFLIDADVGPPWFAPYQLASHDKPVVSGIVCGYQKERGGIFACVAVPDEKGIARFPSLSGTKIIPKSGIVQVRNAGTGCLIIRRDVLETMWQRYEDDHSFGQPFELTMEEMRRAGETGAMPRGEDICFTDRARELGFDVWADFSVRCAHRKDFDIIWPQESATDMSVEDWRISHLDKQVRQF